MQEILVCLSLRLASDQIYGVFTDFTHDKVSVSNTTAAVCVRVSSDVITACVSQISRDEAINKVRLDTEEYVRGVCDMHLLYTSDVLVCVIVICVCVLFREVPAL